MKKTKMILSVITVFTVAFGCLTAYASSEDAAVTERNEEFAEFLTEVKTNQYFTDDPVADEDIEMILKAGINSESGLNQQNWHFSAVTNKDVQQEIADDMGLDLSDPYSKAMIADAPLAIIVSYGEGPGTEFDAGLATQNMNAEALALGYATKIISSPQNVINAEENKDYYHELLGIPDDMSVVGVLLVGMPEDTSTFEDQDAVTAASTRNDYSEMTTIVD